MKKLPVDEEALMITGMVPDLEGINAFIIVIRETHDPKRSSRKERQARGDGYLGWQRWKKKLKETPLEELAELIMTHLSDGHARTLNRIGVEMLDKTADILFQTKFEEALWQLVLQKRVEYSPHAPILFRKRTRVAWDASVMLEGPPEEVQHGQRTTPQVQAADRRQDEHQEEDESGCAV